jgi:RNA polymerase sigma-70 factor (ECF subfamily)
MSNPADTHSRNSTPTETSQAFAVHYDSNVESIYAYFFYRVRDKEWAEDLTSQTFLKAFERFAQYKAEKGTVRAWLFTIARHQLIDSYRTRKVSASLDSAAELASEENVAATAATRHEAAQILRYLDGLPAQQRDIILLRVWDDLPYEEIAKVMGKSVASCKMLFSRTIHSLREDFAPLAVLLIIFMSRS